MKSLILIGVMFICSSLFKKENYISFEPFGNSDKSLPTTVVCKDSTNIKEFSEFDFVSVIGNRYYDTVKNIVIKNNPHKNVVSDYSGNFKITVDENGSEISFF
jgi:hypothetical protein